MVGSHLRRWSYFALAWSLWDSRLWASSIKPPLSVGLPELSLNIWVVQTLHVYISYPWHIGHIKLLLLSSSSFIWCTYKRAKNTSVKIRKLTGLFRIMLWDNQNNTQQSNKGKNYWIFEEIFSLTLWSVLHNAWNPIEVITVNALTAVLSPRSQVPNPLGPHVRVEHLAKAADGIPSSDNPDDQPQLK